MGILWVTVSLLSASDCLIKSDTPKEYKERAHSDEVDETTLNSVALRGADERVIKHSRSHPLSN